MTVVYLNHSAYFINRGASSNKRTTQEEWKRKKKEKEKDMRCFNIWYCPETMIDCKRRNKILTLLASAKIWSNVRGKIVTKLLQSSWIYNSLKKLFKFLYNFRPPFEYLMSKRQAGSTRVSADAHSSKCLRSYHPKVNTKVFIIRNWKNLKHYEIRE